MAYKAVRKKGLQKKLDERAIKNEGLYKKQENEIKDLISKLDFNALREKHKDLIASLGECPLSCNDLIECMQAGDCFCLSLDIFRNDAAISDASKLVIKDIIPTFMSGDSFLDAAIFSLPKNDSDNRQPAIAQGVGREKVTGVMPLYLFKEHWLLAKRKCGPIFGFLCTLDIMGYQSSQYFTIPFLVLLECMRKREAEGDKDVYVKIEKMVLDTCVNIIDFHEEFRNNLIKQLKDFYESAELRTADVVPSIEVMMAQMLCLRSSENYEKYMGEDFKLNREQLEVITRFAFEELFRRRSKVQDPIGKSSILNILFPQYGPYVDNLMNEREKEIDAEFKRTQNSQDQNQFAPYAFLAD